MGKQEKWPEGWSPSTDPWYQKIHKEQEQRHEERFSKPPFGWKEYPRLKGIAGVKFIDHDGHEWPLILLNNGARGLMEVLDVFYDEQQCAERERREKEEAA
jgi:hypothetical protein